MRQPLTGTERIYADIIMDRLRGLGYRFERRRIMPELSSSATEQGESLQGLSAAEDRVLDRVAGKLRLKQ